MKKATIYALFFLIVLEFSFFQSFGQDREKAKAVVENSVYQYSVPVETRTAYLWIPPHCSYVRGVIFAAENALERNWMEDPIIRKTASDENLAIIWLADGKNSSITWEMKPEAASVMDKMFRDLAIESGYDELEFAPIIVTGHSWNGRHAWTYPARRPDRVIATVAIRTYPLPDTLLFSGIPFCYIVGQTTELPQYSDGRPGDRDFFWPVVRKTATALRSNNPDNLLGVVTNPGGCHMDWTPDQSRFLSLFIRKACQYRLPGTKTKNGKTLLKKISRESGWLTDTGNLEPDIFPPAPYKKYKGDPRKAYWFFDKEMALAAIAFNGDRIQKQKQMVTFVQKGDTLKVGRTGSVQLRWNVNPVDGTFKVRGGFLNQVPSGLIDSTIRLSHAAGPVKLYPILGPVIQIDSNTFKIQFDRQSPRNIVIMADHPGNSRFRRATQPATLAVPLLKDGMPQQIQFPSIADVKAGTFSIKLNATASSGLPVQYFIKSGPAIIKEDTLIFTEVPVKSKYPVKVSVVAWQYGSQTEPRIKTAEAVVRSFWITR